MPNFRITAPDGTQYNVTGPDGATEQDALAQVQAQHSQAPAQPQASAAEAPLQDPSVMDRLRANPVVGAPLQTVLRAGQGVEQLAAHGAASLFDLGGLAPNQVSRALRGVSGAVDQAISSQNQGYESAGARVDAASTNPRASKAFRSTGEIMGNMLNPAGMAGNAIEAAPGLVNAGLRGAASGAGFGASQPVLNDENYWLQKAGQVAVGAGTGGVTGTAAARLGGERMRPNPPPTTQQLRGQADEAYAQARDAGVVIRQDSFNNAVDEIERVAQRSGLRPRIDTRAADAIDAMREEAQHGPLTLERADELRQVASRVLNSQDRGERRIGHIIVDSLDDYIDSLGPQDVTSAGNPQIATQALNRGREVYARSAKSAEIERLMERARNAVGANYTTAGLETATRQQFRALANNDRAMRRFTPDERAAITQVVRGGPVQNVLRMVGRFSPRGVMTGAGYGYGFTQSPEIAAAVGAGTTAARVAADHLSARNVRLAHELIRSGGQPLAPLPGPTPNVPVGNTATALMVQALLQPRAQ